MNYSIRTCALANRQTQRGLSLVELMISITIGLLILSSMATLFSNQSKTRSELDKSNRMIDNGRYALDVLSENLRVAGFYGELDPSSTALPASITDPCSTTPADMAGAIRLHVGGYNAATASSAIASPPCGLTSASLKAGSDILVLRRADTSDPIAQGSATDGIHYIQVSNCQYEVGTPFIIANAAASFNLSQRNCTAANNAPFANVRRFIVQTYFVSPNNNGSDGIPTLKRRELDPAGTGAFVTTPLVEGIEYLQVEYGQDTNNDGVADSYAQTCADVTCWSNIVSVKLNIIARNTETTASYTDAKTYSLGLAGSYTPAGGDRNYKRHAYTQVVRLVNPASRRESP
ncbi:PilW family protein [Candidatus Ferrigenium straubiae]|jgi:type IV pilus assembly protein PilW|uniref:PilW family protein n=1 Tax=Candidatus Ferrigenium straubiae TaxID=2919506 RepID=UPI003F4A91E0